MSQKSGFFYVKRLPKKIHHFLFSIVFLLLGTTVADAAGYTCATKRYTSCAANYYLTSSSAGNSCAACSGVTNNTSTRSGTESCTRSCSIANGTCSYSGSTRTYTDTCNGKYTGGSGGSTVGTGTCTGCTSYTRTSTGTCTGGTISITCNTGYHLSNNQCVANTYTVTYNANGGSGTTASSSHTYDTAKALTANGFSLAGYNFAGWATSASGSVVYSNKQSVSNLTATNGGTVTLYAKWSPITVNCPAGTFMWHWSGSSYTYCESCHAGYYCPGGTNVYASGGVNSTNSAGVVPIYTCPNGYKSGGKGLAKQSDCLISVEAGKYVKTAKETSASGTCAAGTYRGAHTVNYGSTSSCYSCPSPNVSGSIYVYSGSSLVTSTSGATAATQCYLDSSIKDYWTHNASFHGFYRCLGKQYYNATTGYYSDCENKKYFSECNAGYFIDSSTTFNSEFSNTCSECAAGTYTEKVSTASSIGDGTYHYQTSCTKCAANTYNPNTKSTSASACTACPTAYPYSDAGTSSDGYCYATGTKYGTQNDPAMPTGCAARTLSACNVGSCNYRDYKTATDTTCTPTNCTKGQTCTSASADYYLDSGVAKQCSAYSATYPDSDGGNIDYKYCYKTVTKTGNQNNGVTPAGCASVTAWNTCTPGTCNYKDYNGATDGSCTPADCVKDPKTVTASANYYVSGTTCPACPTAYPSSDGGNIGEGNCYVTKTNTGSQLACSTPSGCASATCGTCTPGTCNWRDYKSATDTTCTPTNCTKPVASVTANANRYVSGATCPACSSKNSGYPYSAGGNISYTSCYSSTKSRAWSGSQTACSKPSNCASVTCNSCSGSACNYVAYLNSAGTGDGTIKEGCSSNSAACQQTVKSVTANANYYVDGTTCPACSSKNSGYPYSAGGNISYTSCYSGTKSRAWSGSQTACSKPSNCASVTCNSCSGSACNYVAYLNSAGTGDGTIKEGCSSNSAACQQTVKSVTANANYYVDGTTCPACSSKSSSYPKSDGGNINYTYCYKDGTKTGSQNACSQPANSASYTCGTCTPGTCTYKDYNGATDTTCTPTNCDKPVATVSCKANFYASGVTCPACPTAYPYSDAGTSSEGYCYTSKTNTGSQNACSQPANSASYTCGTCTPGTCNWRDYKSATDTTCTPTNCDKPVASVTCNTGFYTSGVTCPACTNKPDNSAYTGTATSNACPWSCNTGYGQTSANLCAQICTAGFQHLKSSTGVSIPLYTSAQTTHSIVVQSQSGAMCYASLASGAASGAINVNLNGTTYHAIK